MSHTPINSRTWVLGLLLAALVWATTAHAAPPKPDFTNLPAYITALNRSTDPQAIAIRQEIADGPAALARERTAARAAGIPLDAAQLQRPLPPPDRNAAPLFQQLDALRQAKPLGLPQYAQPLSGSYAYTPAQLAAVQQIVESRRDVFDLLHQAADRPECVFSNLDIGDPAVSFPFIARRREDARELTTESYLLAAQGHDANAIANQARGFRVARDVAVSDPCMIGYLVADAIDAITVAGMDHILYQAGSEADVDAQVQRVLSVDDLPLPLGNCLKGDAALTLKLLNPLEAKPGSVAEVLRPNGTAVPPIPMSDVRFATNLIDAAEARYLSRMLIIIAAVDQPDFRRRASFASVSQPRASDTSQSLDPVTALVEVVTFSDFTAVVNHDDQMRTSAQVTMAAAAILAVKARTGTFPTTLPGDFPDAFSGKPLGYRREGENGFVVYSVGTDGTFDGGTPGQYHFTPYQTFFRYPGPPLPPVPPDMGG